MRHRTVAPHIYLLMTVAACVVLTACNKPSELSKSLIVGRVTGNSHPLQGATVAIANTQFSATTDYTGNYEVEYVPGVLDVTVSAPNYLPKTVQLNISVPSKFPAATIDLIPLPEKTVLIAHCREWFKTLNTGSLWASDFTNVFDVTKLDVRNIMVTSIDSCTAVFDVTYVTKGPINHQSMFALQYPKLCNFQNDIEAGQQIPWSFSIALIHDSAQGWKWGGFAR